MGGVPPLYWLPVVAIILSHCQYTQWHTGVHCGYHYFKQMPVNWGYLGKPAALVCHKFDFFGMVDKIIRQADRLTESGQEK